MNSFKNLRLVQIMGNIWLLLVLLTPMIVLSIMPESTPKKNSKFVDGITNNSALWPTKEYRDSLAYFITLFLVIITAALVMRISKFYVVKLVWFSPAITVTITFLLINTVHLDSRLRPINEGFYFEGLTQEDFIFSLIVVFGLVAVFIIRNRFLALFIQIASVAISVPCFFSFVMLTTTNGDISNSQFVTNEMLSVAAGLNPLFSFSSQYSSGLPYLVRLITLFDGISPYSAVSILFTFLSLTILISCLFLVCRITRDLTSRMFSFSLIVASIAYTPKNGGSLTSYLQGFPIRTMIPVLLAVIVCQVNWVNRARTEFTAGILGVCLVLVNFDFGIAAFFALGSVVLLQRFSYEPARPIRIGISLVRFLTPLALGLTALRIAQISTPSTCGFICTGEFSYLFGGTGFFAAPQPTFGIHQAIFFTAVVGLIVGISEHIRSCRDNHNVLLRLLVSRLLVSLSVFICLSYPYYVNRSYAAVLTQYFLPCTAVLLLLVRLITLSYLHVARYRAFSTMMIGLLLIVPISNLRHLPPIDKVSNRIFDPPISMNFRSVSEWSELPLIIAETVLYKEVKRNQIGLVSRNAMPDAISNHILPAIPYNSPLSVVLKSQQKFACTFLLSSHLEVLVIKTDSDSEDLRDILECAEFRNFVTMSGYSIATKD